MQFVFLFDSKSPGMGIIYSETVRNEVFKTRVLQSNGQQCTISHGDINVFGQVRTWEAFNALSDATYFSSAPIHLFADRIRKTYRKSTIFAWRIDSIPSSLALALHTALVDVGVMGYLGFHSVDPNNAAHILFYRQSLILAFGVDNQTCIVPKGFGEDPIADGYHQESRELRSLGFKRVRRLYSSDPWWIRYTDA